MIAHSVPDLSIRVGLSDYRIMSVKCRAFYGLKIFGKKIKMQMDRSGINLCTFQIIFVQGC